MKSVSVDRQVWVECAGLIGLSALTAALLGVVFGRYRPKQIVQKDPAEKTTSLPWEKPNEEEKAQAEPVRRALNQATARIDTPQKANKVSERLEALAGSTTTSEVEQSMQPEKAGKVSDRVAEASQRIEQAAKSAPSGDKVADGIAQAALEITSSPGRERDVLSEATQETLNPEQQDTSRSANKKQREYLRQAILKRMKPLDALDAQIFLAINHLPHNRWLNGFFGFFTLIFAGGIGWYLILILTAIIDTRKGLHLVRQIVLPLSAASSLVEFPIKAFFHRKRPFIAYLQAIVIGKKPGSWSFPSGHSASSFAGAWLLSGEYPRQSMVFFLIAGLVGFSRIYLGDHYPGDVLSGAFSGMALAESVQRVQQVVIRDAKRKNG